jgi:hypothetical protein
MQWEHVAAMAQIEQDVIDLQWECAKLRYYCEALERRVTPEQRAAALDEAAAAVAQHDPPDRP